jgi:hypothetical protein
MGKRNSNHSKRFERLEQLERLNCLLRFLTHEQPARSANLADHGPSKRLHRVDAGQAAP